MKKFKKRVLLIIGIILAIIIVSGISVYATYNYLAENIVYTKKDGTEINVETALNELYEKYNSPYNVPTLVGHGENSYSSGITTETKITGTVDNNEILELSNNVFTTKKTGYYLIIYSVGSNVAAVQASSYTGHTKLYVNNKNVGTTSASYSTYNFNHYIIKLDSGSSIYATYRGDGDNYQKKSLYRIYYVE